MALQALIPTLPVASGPDQIAVFVQYYDDANVANQPTPTVFLDQETLLFATATTAKADVVGAIVARGQALKVTQAKIATIDQTFSAPITIAIP